MMLCFLGDASVFIIGVLGAPIARVESGGGVAHVDMVGAFVVGKWCGVGCGVVGGRGAPIDMLVVRVLEVWAQLCFLIGMLVALLGWWWWRWGGGRGDRRSDGSLCVLAGGRGGGARSSI